LGPIQMLEHQRHLKGILEHHQSLTGSARASELLGRFDHWLARFWLVKPKAANIESLLESLKAAA